MQYGIFIRPAATICDQPAPTQTGADGRLLSTIGDEGLYGQTCQVLEEAGAMVRVRTFYGYPGYAARADLHILP